MSAATTALTPARLSSGDMARVASVGLRAYPCRAVAVRAAWARLKAIMPLASWRRARWFSSFLDQRTRIARLRLSHE